jgi:hypothetical protein
MLFFWACQRFFLLARYGRKTDWHILFRSMFSMFSMYLGIPKVAKKRPKWFVRARQNYEYWNYDFDFCACGWGRVLSRFFWPGKVWFYDFMIPGNEPVDTALNAFPPWDLLQLIWKLHRIDSTWLIIDPTYFFPK